MRVAGEAKERSEAVAVWQERLRGVDKQLKTQSERTIAFSRENIALILTLNDVAAASVFQLAQNDSHIVRSEVGSGGPRR